ncbi:zinc metallochaperone AztD [Candidatus Symbiopectobacterium sp. NZEC151]|uniref:zinc metallochaperone AztD n=1 Tax=Candidatus Symbiopectobacterium sp. NZEC151 TaxID=2820470 RepID=UPI002227EEB4|nr:zinc metallochaperone AztD [Candidatus Symbiopectobacterium sp. NZEC151]MCW2473301.1 metallochaperone AztD [Candidatus Symbiopectobacterium sp. NZEC151]
MKRRLLSLTIATIFIGFAATPSLAEDVNAWRLFVADHDKPVITVIDALDGDKLNTFSVTGPATLYRSESGAVVFAVQGSANTVTALSSGISFHDHGDHADIDVDDPALLNVEFTGAKPGHFVERQGNVAQWFDGEKHALLFNEQAVLQGKNAATSVNVVAAHHGVAVPYDHYAVVSIPNPEDASKRPVGARVVGLDGKKVGEDALCPGLHGSAGSGNRYALACSTGLLLITQNTAAPEIKHLPYSPSLPQGSVSTLIGGKGMQYFIGNYGPDRIVLIDPTQSDSFRLIQLPTRRVHFAVDPVRAKYAYVFTEDGKLHQVDVIKGQITQSVRVTEPYSMDGHWNDPRPRIAVADDKIFVTDPLKSKIHVLDAVAFTESGEIPVDGQPFNIVAVGGSGKVHDDGHHHQHEHHHDDAKKGK